jgi:hypothetical protein
MMTASKTPAGSGCGGGGRGRGPARWGFGAGQGRETACGAVSGGRGAGCLRRGGRGMDARCLAPCPAPPPGSAPSPPPGRTGVTGDVELVPAVVAPDHLAHACPRAQPRPALARARLECAPRDLRQALCDREGARVGRRQEAHEGGERVHAGQTLTIVDPVNRARELAREAGGAEAPDASEVPLRGGGAGGSGVPGRAWVGTCPAGAAPRPKPRPRAPTSRPPGRPPPATRPAPPGARPPPAASAPTGPSPAASPRAS